MSGAGLGTPVVVAAVSLRCLLTQSASADGAWVLWFAQGSLFPHGVLAQDSDACAQDLGNAGAPMALRRPKTRSEKLSLATERAWRRAAGRRSERSRAALRERETARCTI